MSRFKKWLVDRFLPTWAAETLVDELEYARHQLERQKQINRELESYARGLEYALRHLPRGKSEI